LYLLNNPDHYKSHEFCTFYWSNYVKEMMKSWKSHEEMETDNLPEKIVIQKKRNKYIGVSVVYDYIYRPQIYKNKTLYEWVQMAERRKRSIKSHKHNISDSTTEMKQKTKLLIIHII